MSKQPQPVALAIGAGDAIGAAFARRFAAGGFSIAVARRQAAKADDLIAELSDKGKTARAFGMDARQEVDVQALFATIEQDMGPVEVCLYNAGANAKFPIRETTSEMFRKVWELGCYGGFLTGREAARYMVPRGHGTILFTGATASMRGGTGFAAFASAKFGLRAIAQSLARELGPEGIHVAHLVIDGGVDSPVVRARRRASAGRDIDHPPDSLMATSSIAEAYWMLHSQARDAWSHEVDIRSFVESW